MSFFTDDDVKPEIVDIVDPKETFHKPIGFGETVSNSRTAHKHAESVLSPYYNEQEAITKRSDYVRTREGREVDEVLKDFGYSGAYAGSQRYGGDRDLDEKDRDEAFKRYRASLPENERENVLVGEALRLQGIELGRKLTLEAKEKLKKTKLGTFGNLFANFLGAGSVMMQNPLFVASQIVLPEVVFAKYLATGRGLTLGARVGARAGIEGVAGGAYEVVTQPFVAAKKKEMKLKHTSGDVMRNILFGTVFGASFGGAFEIGAGGLRKLRTGEWGISEYNSHVAKHYDQMPPELRHAHELVDQATENGRLNPFGDTPEGVQRHIDETLKAEQFVNQEIRDVPQGDIEAAQNLAKEIEAQSNELPDVQKLRDEFLAEHQLTPAPKPEGDIPDGFAFLNDVANDILPENVRVQVVDEIEKATGVRLQQDIEPHQHNGLRNDIGTVKLQEDTKAFQADIEDFIKNYSKNDLALIESLRRELDRPNFNRMLDELESLGIIEKDSYGQYVKLTGIEKEIEAVLEDAKRILPNDTKFEIVDTIDDAYGFYNPQLKLVQLAKDADNLGSTLRHEGLHALRSRLKSSEWKVLVEASDKIEFPKADLYLDELTEKYKDKGFAGDVLTVDTFKEERVANLIEYAYKGGDLSKLEPKPRNLIEKIISWIKAIATTLDSPKYNKLQRILDGMESGEIAKRNPRKNINHKKEALFSKDSNPNLKAKSTTDSLTGTHIEAPDELYNWLDVEPAKFQADYTKIAKKREATQKNNPLSDPEKVRDHVEHTLGNAVFALRHREGNWNLISIDGIGRLTSVDLRIKKRQYRVVTAHTLSNGQLEDKIRGVFKEHGEDGFKWKVDPRRSQSGVPQEDPSFVIRMGINDQLSAEDIIRYIREMQGFQGRAGHPSVFSNSLEDGIQGAFRSTDNLIQIARSAVDPTATLRHEAIHALKALDLFKAEEWSLLEETARQMDWIKKHDIEARYKAEFDGDEATRQRAMLEEAIAEEFSKWRRGELEVTQEIKTIFERIQALLGQIAEALRRAGINDFEDVFKRIESGEIKNRQLPELRDDVQYEIGVGQKGETVTPRELVERADYELQQAEAIGLCLKVA